MARRKGGKKGNKKTFGARDDTRARVGWNDLVRENEKWEKYYKSLGLIKEDEWDSFKKTCQSPLPLTFRITGSRKHSSEVLNLFKEKHLPNLTDVTFEGEKIKAPMELKWYPNDYAWQLDVPKTVIRKNEQFAKTQRFLVLENAVGNISRQEAVSMIPPIVLEVEPQHTVLDMCAAPGSKTAQLIEALHKDTDEPSGFVVANDADARRSHMLVHQLKRLNSANLLVVNHDAQFFPRIRTNEDTKDFLKFDRILCDVPCSGDGTMRKNVNVWKDWNTQGALGLHTVQYNILNRGLHLLKNGGRLVYSTCSLNPIENEAVVAAALRKWGDKIRLVNCDDKLPGLIRDHGVSKWPVFDRNMEVRSKTDEGMLESWFEPSTEETEKFGLNNCMRVYPHKQNTGGFFITVFEKVDDDQATSSTSSNKRSATPSATSSEPAAKMLKNNDAEAQKKERLPRDANEEPFIFVDPEHKSLKTCWSFYGIDDKFEKNTCLVRNGTGEPTRVVYTVAPSLRDIIRSNDDRLKMIYSGVKLFVSQRSDIECSWRIQSESLPIMKHHMTSNRIIKGNPEMLKLLLKEAFPTYDDLEREPLDPEFVKEMRAISSGCAFIDVQRNDDNKENLFLPVWKGTKCINLMVSKEDTHELLYRVFGVETSAKDNKQAQKQAEHQQAKAEETPVAAATVDEESK
ncbi:similar to Saccharomyces cerevisiae YBL024W NCL1 S-adenosyl-L-methionine-dependent tRNA: m5C-methyltransferase [Maudiozyma saulgeensis]|uniref:Similar to Saccharomyces cerevisiae YBL024W NCL1 S-adenosyl-L-methionine-dependent tRNA: m5C-methyltransferase n=1 Tax=Maudiozyma saulgeensis TaxID=1789683 RepID=A0A1X7R7X4_9SACH|nr:similar to Saccharomyces cerevisiae YBL024W NCL1 S-adenosyl-L-methionine-dependent tRNA: m5C-methyltransferase [Kazachstania saulgeensis]